MLLHRFAPLAALALVAASCSHAQIVLPPDVDGPVVMDSRVVTLQRTADGWRGELGYLFVNVTPRTISLVNCHGAYGLSLEKWLDGQWVRAYTPVLPMCLSGPIEIRPGTAHERRFELFAGPRGSNLYPQFEVEPVAGTYRLVIEAAYWNYDHRATGGNWGTPVPLEDRVSDPFEIRTD
jgi:hypothetical protein